MTAIAFRASALASFSTTTATKSVVIPVQVVTNDLMFLAFSAASTGRPTAAPSGWTAVPGGNGVNGVGADLYYRIAQGGDAGSTVTVTQQAQTRAILALTAYTGVDLASPLGAVATLSETTAQTNHPAAALTTTGSGWVARFLFTKDGGATASTAFTPPAGYTIRQQQAGASFSGTNQITLAVADSNADVGAGAQTGTWGSDNSTINAIAIAVELEPLTATVTVRPNADITTTGYALVGGASAFSVLADDDPNTYVECSAGTSTVEVKMATPTAAPTTISVKFYGAGSPAAMQVVTSLMQGATTVASWTDNTVYTTETTKTYTLTAPQQAACTNLADLRVRQVATVS